MGIAMTWLAVTYEPTLRALFQPQQLALTYIILLLGTIVFPLVNLGLLWRFGMVKSLSLYEKSERPVPFVVIFIYYAFVYWVLRKGMLPHDYYLLFFSALMCMGTVVVITFFFKISVHAAGICAVIGALAALFQRNQTGNAGLLLVLVLLSGVVMSARLAENAHTSREVYAGALIGFFAAYISCLNGWMI